MIEDGRTRDVIRTLGVSQGYIYIYPECLETFPSNSKVTSDLVQVRRGQQQLEMTVTCDFQR